MKINRPLSPHLNVYKPQLTSILSILHRISGGFLAVFLLASIFSLKLSECCLSFYIVYSTFFFVTTNLYWLVLSLLNFALLAICYHISNGIRHLLWDLGFFLELSKVYTTGTITVIFSIILFLAINFLRIHF